MKRYFLFFLTIVTAFAYIGLSSFIGSRKIIYKNQAAEAKNTYQPKRFKKKSNGIKKVVWEEKKIEKAIVNQSLNIKITRSKSANSDPLPITGNWEGKTIKVVPDDKFPNIFKDSVDLNGVKSIKNMPDNKIFIGNYNAFAVKNPDDSDWNNLITYELPYNDPNKTTVLFFTPTMSDNYEVYLGDDYTSGGRIVRMKTDNTFELVVDPTDLYGYLRGTEVVPYQTNDGVVAWRQHEIYYLEKGSLRKWITPYKSCGGYSDYDHIATIATDSYDEHYTYGLVSELSFEGYCQPVYTTYLYKYEFSSNPNIPLEITKYGKVTGSSGNWNKVSFLSKRLDDPTVKMLYGITEVTTDKLSVIPYLYTDGTDMISTYYIIDPGIGNRFYDFNAELKSNNQTDNLWFTDREVRGISLGRYFDSSNPPPYFLRLYDLNLIANPYINTVTSDNNNMVYAGHDYLPNQFNNAMVTILEGPINTPTPTPSPTALPTPTPTLSPNPYFGNSISIHYPDPQGYATIPYKPKLSLNDVFTIEGWINMNDSNNDSILVSQHMTTGPNNESPYTVYYSGYNNKLAIQLLDSSGNWSFFETQTQVLPQQWYYFAFVKDHTTMKIFINGNLDSTNSVSENLAINTNYLTLAAYKANEVVEFGYDGLIEELRMSDNARYSANFTLQSRPFTSDQNTLLLYHFDETNDVTSFKDSSGENSDGTIVGQIEFIPSTVTAPIPLPSPSSR